MRPATQVLVVKESSLPGGSCPRNSQPSPLIATTRVCLLQLATPPSVICVLRTPKALARAVEYDENNLVLVVLCLNQVPVSSCYAKHSAASPPQSFIISVDHSIPSRASDPFVLDYSHSSPFIGREVKTPSCDWSHLHTESTLRRSSSELVIQPIATHKQCQPDVDNC